MREVLGIKCPPWVWLGRGVEVPGTGGGHKEIRLELSWALAGLKIPKICLSDMWFPVYRRVAARDKGAGVGVPHPDLGKGQDLRFIRSRGCREPTVRGIATRNYLCSPKEAHHDYPLHQDFGR